MPAAFEPPWPAGQNPPGRPQRIEDEFGTYEFAEINAYGDTTHTFVDRSRYNGYLCAGILAHRPRSIQPRLVSPGRSQGHRPRRRQRRGGQDGRLGRLLQQDHGFLGHGQLRRQGYQHRVLGTDVQGCRRRPRPDQVSDQRAGQEPARSQIDEFLRVLRRAGRAAHRHGHRRHH